MTLEDQCELSYYQRIATINEGHSVFLVQHATDRTVYVMKHLNVYDITVFRQLQAHPVHDTPLIHRLFENENELIVIEEYISGTSLQEILEKEGSLQESRVKDIILQLCDILKELHALSPPVIHRDIKPSNILISTDGRVKLLDMNAAKHVQNGKARDTHLIGTVGYAAPEQYGFGVSSVQTDIYAIGVLLNVLLTGTFPQEKLAEGPLAEVITSCTRMEAGDRYASIDDLVLALKKKPRNGRYIKYLPPGFRSLRPGRMIAATFIYICLVTAAVSADPHGISQPMKIMERIGWLIAFLSIAFFSGNYLGIQDKLRFSRLNHRWLRVVVIILIDICIASVMLTIMILLGMAIGDI